MLTNPQIKKRQKKMCLSDPSDHFLMKRGIYWSLSNMFHVQLIIKMQPNKTVRTFVQNNPPQYNQTVCLDCKSRKVKAMLVHLVRNKQLGCKMITLKTVILLKLKNNMRQQFPSSCLLFCILQIGWTSQSGLGFLTHTVFLFPQLRPFKNVCLAANSAPLYVKVWVV